jgi:2-hydroxychromene-2-carboxylate isomerase
LADLAGAVGVGAETAARLGDRSYLDAILGETADALDFGVQGTPTVLVSRDGVGRLMWDGETPLADLVRRLGAA